MTAEDKIKWALQTCREAGFRRTHSLTLVLRRLAERPMPVPVSELSADPDLRGAHDKATVYRILARLEELGLVRRVGLHERSAAYALHTPGQHHDYLICTGCGAMSDVSDSDCPVGVLCKRLEKSLGFKVSRHEMILWGTCTRCAGEKPGAKAAPAKPKRRARWQGKGA